MYTNTVVTSPSDLRVDVAVKLFATVPVLTVEQVMLAAKFCPADAATMQMWIRRRAPSKKDIHTAALFC